MESVKFDLEAFALFSGGVFVVTALVIVAAWAVFRHRLGTRIIAFYVLAIATCAILSFFVGQTGIQWATMGPSLPAGIASILVASWLLYRSVVGPIVHLANHAERVGKGDLQLSIEQVTRRDEIGELQGLFAQMVSELSTLLSEIQGGAATLSSSAAELAATARQASVSATEQSTTVAEISVTVDEISSTSRTAAADAQAVIEASAGAAREGRSGLHATQETDALMAVIRERVEGIAAKILDLSEKNLQIGQIVETVNNISEQSNLLAVNASIEAAKAGDQGRGFSVVATEVRSLAEQSKRATAQIRAILAEIQKATETAVMATEEGVKRVGDGREQIEEVKAVIQALAEVLESGAETSRSITSSAEAQASGIETIARAVRDVSSSGEDAADAAHQLDDSANALADIAARLQATTERFAL